jgi:hypothetical protein
MIPDAGTDQRGRSEIAMRRMPRFPTRSILHGLALGLALALAGCAGTGTREMPATELPAATPARGALAGQSLAAEGLAADAAEVSGGHHEGILQVRQPWIWGLSDEQKAALYGDAREIARLAFLDELKRHGLKVRLDGDGGKAAGLALSGRLASIELNTYGRGLSGRFEGFGSAGDYWEARVRFVDLELREAKTGTALWRGDLARYAKRPDSPAKLEYSHWDLLANSLRIGLAGNNPRKLYDAVKGSGADYALAVPTTPAKPGEPGGGKGSKPDNPVELAARLAARDLLSALQKLPRFSGAR